jgi:hypothetical protein
MHVTISQDIVPRERPQGWDISPALCVRIPSLYERCLSYFRVHPSLAVTNIPLEILDDIIRLRDNQHQYGLTVITNHLTSNVKVTSRWYNDMNMKLLTSYIDYGDNIYAHITEIDGHLFKMFYDMRPGGFSIHALNIDFAHKKWLARLHNLGVDSSIIRIYNGKGIYDDIRGKYHLFFVVCQN